MSFSPVSHTNGDVVIASNEILKASEKKRAEQTADLEQVNYELSDVKKSYASMEKRLNNNERELSEQAALEQESREKTETMKRRLNDYSSQISTLKQEKEEAHKSDRELRKKIEQLQERIEDMEHENENTERKHQDMTRHVTRVQEQLEIANTSVSELTEDVEKANSRGDKCHKDLLLAMEQHTNALAEKDEEVNMVKNTCRGTINLLKDQLEAAEMEISRLNVIKKDLEQENMLIQGDLDEAEATVMELNNEIPRQQDILEQLNMNLGEVNARCEALQEALVRADMKCSQLASRNEELEDELKKDQMQKRLTDQDNIDLNNKLSEQCARTEALMDTLSKMEAQVATQMTTLEQLEEDKSDWDREKRKMRELITMLEADNQHLDEVKCGLELSENKLKMRLRDTISEQEDLVKSLKTSNRTKTRSLESRIAELENTLEEETEMRIGCEKAVKKLERMLKELEIQANEDTQSMERHIEQINTLSNRNKQLKVQYADSEARVTSLQAKLRKLTVEIEESENRTATMTKMLSTPAQSRTGTPASGIIRQSAMMRSMAGSRCSSRLITPEVEHILMSGRNSPAGPLSILSSGRNSPISPGFPRGENFAFDQDSKPDEEIITDQCEASPETTEEEQKEAIMPPQVTVSTTEQTENTTSVELEDC